jgi:flagella basal body P-ring formation protein FlgA
MKSYLLVLLATFFTASLVAYAESQPFALRVKGRAEVLVTTDSLRFGDIADVSAHDLLHDDEVIGLKKIHLGNSPAPGSTAQLSAQTVIDKLRAAGVDLNRIGYSFPAVITVKRAGRQLGVDEVRAALSLSLDRTGRSAALRSIRYDGSMWIPPGYTEIRAEPVAQTSQGLLPFLLRVLVDGKEINARTVEASIDEWTELPVARRSIPSGEVVSIDDLARARMNAATLPRDAVSSELAIIGKRTKTEISIGEPFRKDKLSTPAVVEAGQKVSMLYRNGRFEVTATGVALEAGARGEEVRIRNESSKKIITATVIEPGLVGVTP